jgi:hypothetical protein
MLASIFCKIIERQKLCDTLRRFGEYLIGLARQGYGAELKFP